MIEALEPRQLFSVSIPAVVTAPVPPSAATVVADKDTKTPPKDTKTPPIKPIVYTMSDVLVSSY